MRRDRSHWLAGLTAAGLSVGIGLLLHWLVLGRALVDWSYDLFFAVRPALNPNDVVMVYMDDDSHARLEQAWNAPWDRRLHARLIDRLTRAGARLVVFDVVFSDPWPDPETDRLLAEAIRNNGRVILAADTVPAGYGSGVEMRMVTPPTESLREGAAGIGSAELLPAHDFVVREHFHGSEEDLVASLSWEAARSCQVETTQNPKARFESRWVNYYGPAGTLPSVSYHLALNESAVPDTFFNGRIVYVGARLFTVFAGERKDEFRTPYSYWNDRFMPGVEVQATLLLNLLRGDWLSRFALGWERLLLILVGLVAGLWLTGLGPWRGALQGTLFGAAVIAISYWLAASRGVWFPWLILEVQLAVCTAVAVVAHYARLFLEHRLLEQSLSVHLSAKYVKQLIKRPELLRPGAEKLEVTILFSDIANFTKISEGMDSDELAKLMNGYFEKAISRCIHKADGYVVKYIGDAIFAIWNAPLRQPEHREHGCQAALLLRDEIVEFEGNQGVRLLTRVGLHTGLANVGNFGSSTRLDYTALGENVNLASRMEGLNKHLGTQVLITRDTQAAVDKSMVTRFVGQFRLKGFERSVEVYELIGLAETAESTRAWRECFAEALGYFQQREFFKAREQFKRTLELHPDDGPSHFYIVEMIDMVPSLLPDDWAGEVILQEK